MTRQINRVHSSDREFSSMYFITSQMFNLASIPDDRFSTSSSSDAAHACNGAAGFNFGFGGKAGFDKSRSPRSTVSVDNFGFVIGTGFFEEFELLGWLGPAASASSDPSRCWLVTVLVVFCSNLSKLSSILQTQTADTHTYQIRL